MALLGGTRKDLEEQVEQGFPLLPSGCSIQLTEDAKNIVLANIRESLSSRSSSIVEALRRLGERGSLVALLEESGLTIAEIYRKRSLTGLRREAGLPVPPKGPDEDLLSRGIARLITMDSPSLLSRISADCKSAEPPAPSLAWKIVMATLMPEMALADTPGALAKFWQHRGLVDELGELSAHLASINDYTPLPFLDGSFGLELHCHYQRKQIIAALTGASRNKLHTSREGVMFVKEHGFDVFFVTLTKSPDRYSPTTRYKDYPVSRDTFHWQSMSNTTPDSERGKRHIDHVQLGVTPLLFVRAEPEDSLGETTPFLFLGTLEYMSSEGERPISIMWRLLSPMPAAFFEHTRVVA